VTAILPGARIIEASGLEPLTKVLDAEDEIDLVLTTMVVPEPNSLPTTAPALLGASRPTSFVSIAFLVGFSQPPVSTPPKKL
jgi:hypothetical protein